jgi:hypothetical protein
MNMVYLNFKASATLGINLLFRWVQTPLSLYITPLFTSDHTELSSRAQVRLRRYFTSAVQLINGPTRYTTRDTQRLNCRAQKMATCSSIADNTHTRMISTNEEIRLCRHYAQFRSTTADTAAREQYACKCAQSKGSTQHLAQTQGN